MDALSLLITPADAEQELGRRIRAERKRRGWTQAELAERSALSVATIGRLETSGQGQLASLLRVLAAFQRLKDLDDVLAPNAPKTLDELRRLRTRESR